MAINRHKVITEFDADTSGLEEGATRASGAAKKMSSSFSGARAAITGFATGAVVIAAREMISLAAGVEESENLFRVAFGNMADAATDWSNDLEQATGIANFTLREQAATLFGSFDTSFFSSPTHDRGIRCQSAF